jgi:hypothetical protein
MGTNYYMTNLETGERLHICKISAGWKPLFQVHDGKFKSFREILDYYEHEPVVIEDEYDRLVDVVEFKKKVLDRHSDNGNKVNPYARIDSDGFLVTYDEFS